VQKQLLKKSALDDYKHNLRQVSHQTIQDRAVCKTQAENVFMDCLTETTGARIERGSGRVRQHNDAASGGNRAFFWHTFCGLCPGAK
jgi:hypothetical protein